MAKAGKKRIPETGTTTIPIPESWDIPTAIEQKKFQEEFGRKIDRAIAPPWMPPEPQQARAPQPKRKWRRDAVTTVVRELFSDDELAKAPTPDLLKQLGDELDRRGITASSDTQLRALGRR
jgi:hypothetical protein